MEKRRLWEKKVGLQYIDAFLPYPDIIDAESGALDSWLRSMEIHLDPRPGKCGFWYSPHSYQLHRNVTPDSRLIYLQQGTGRVRVGDKDSYRRFRAGDALLIPPSVYHNFITDENAPLQFFSINFDVRLLGGINPLDLIGFPRYLTGSEQSPYGPAAWRMARDFSLRPPGWELSIASELQAILLHLLRFQGASFHPLYVRGRSRRILKLLPALELIDRRLDDPALRIADLASEIAVSEGYLRRLCNDAIGMSPGGFLQRRRIERASVLLRDSTRSLESIASMSGFSHMSHFYQTFKRWTKMTPSQFRADEIGI